jgi:DNA-binding transcriptional LysR family regulator
VAHLYPSGHGEELTLFATGTPARAGGKAELGSRQAQGGSGDVKDLKFAEHLAVFVDVVRGGSFSSAARKRSVTPSSIVRQIDGLEHSLATPLLVRSTRALALTDAGERLFERAQRLLDELADTHAEITAMTGAIAGVLRIACFPSFGKRYVIPVLDALMTEHPELRVELDLTERLADPVLERLDAVIRIGELQDSTLIASKLAAQSRLLVAGPAYLARCGAPETVQALTAHRLIDKLHGADLLGWSDLLGCPVAGVRDGADVFRCDDFEALRQAAVAGLGLALLPDWVVGPDVRMGALVRLALEGEPWNAKQTGVYLLRALLHPSAKLKAFSQALRDHIGSPPIWLP